MKNIVENIVGFGAVGVDIYRPIGSTGRFHEPGGTAGWTPEDEAFANDLEGRGCEALVGGNVVNALAYLSVIDNGIENVHFAGVIGRGDPMSDVIQTQLPEVLVETSRSQIIPGFSPPVSIEERLPFRPIMCRDRHSDLVEPYMSAEYIREVSRDAQVIMVGSFLREPAVSARVFANVPEDAFLTYIPGSGEYKQYPDKLRAMMLERNPTLLALTTHELCDLYETTEEEVCDIRVLAEQATELATYVLCTRGERGAFLAHEGKSRHQRASYVRPRDIVDTTGAGDRAAAIATQSLLKGLSPEKVLLNTTCGAADVLYCRGATADLPYMYKPSSRYSAALAASGKDPRIISPGPWPNQPWLFSSNGHPEPPADHQELLNAAAALNAGQGQRISDLAAFRYTY